MKMAITDIGEKDEFASILIPDYLKSDKMKAPDNASAPIGALCKEVRSAAIIKYAGTSQKAPLIGPSRTAVKRGARWKTAAQMRSQTNILISRD
jgi:hypothetical protein